MQKVDYPAYKCIVRPSLEASIQMRRLHVNKNVDILAGVQSKDTKMISSLIDKLYKYQLNYLNLGTLKSRRISGLSWNSLT